MMVVVLGPVLYQVSRFSKSPTLSSHSWSTDMYLKAHRLVRNSGKYNFESCKIPVPTSIRFDRMREALGDEATAKDLKLLKLIEFGMPIFL